MNVFQRLRDFVANGNSIVVTGGIMSQIFLNRNFLTQVRSSTAAFLFALHLEQFLRVAFAPLNSAGAYLRSSSRSWSQYRATTTTAHSVSTSGSRRPLQRAAPSSTSSVSTFSSRWAIMFMQLNLDRFPLSRGLCSTRWMAA
jgi:hypothetical protein